MKCSWCGWCECSGDKYEREQYCCVGCESVWCDFCARSQLKDQYVLSEYLEFDKCLFCDDDIDRRCFTRSNTSQYLRIKCNKNHNELENEIRDKVRRYRRELVRCVVGDRVSPVPISESVIPRELVELCARYISIDFIIDQCGLF